MDLHSVLAALVFHYPFIRGGIECDFQAWSCLAVVCSSVMAQLQDNRSSCSQLSVKMNLKRAELEPVEATGCFKRLKVNAAMGVEGFPGVWALGNCAVIPDEKGG